MDKIYHFEESRDIISPALIYYRDIIKENTKKAITMAGGPEHLWPHVKTHKMAQMIRLQMDLGINRFKCATIAEGEMAAECGAREVLISYPLIGPNIKRYLNLQQAFLSTNFWAIGDNIKQLQLLGKQAVESGLKVNLLIDVNMGMDRTGVSLSQLADLYAAGNSIEGICLRGLHCYDGHRTESDLDLRQQEADKTLLQIQQIKTQLNSQNYCCDTIVIGGTPSFPCYRNLSDMYFSPGTLFVNDYGYSKKFPDLTFQPGAAVLTRVISHPKHGYFTLDLGYKGIASDPAGTRGTIVGLDHIEELFQSEEHWTYRMESGHEEQRPDIGTELFVIPTHICPTSALYPAATVVADHHVVAKWPVTARNRQLIY